MKNLFDDKYKLLELENLMYLIFIIASLINIIANKELKTLFQKNFSPTIELKDKYIFASYLILLVFIIFLIRNYNNFKKLSPCDKEYNAAKIRFLGSILIVIGQILVIFYFEKTTNFK